MDIHEPTSRLDLLARIYRAGASDLAGLLDSTAFQQGKSARLLSQVNEISRRIGTATDAWVAVNVPDAIDRGRVASDLDLSRLRVPLADSSISAGADFLRINERAVDAFAVQIARDLAGATADARDKTRRIISATSQRVLSDPQLSELIGRGLISGGNLNAISRGLRARLTDAGRQALDEGSLDAGLLEQMADLEAGYITAGQRRMKLTEYCGLVASYQLREAAVHAGKQRLTEAGQALGDPDLFDLVTIVGPISGDWCDFYVGKIFSVSGRSDQWPALDDTPGGGPPYHPNCTHTIAPFVPDLADGREIERGRINPSLLGLDGRAADRAYRGSSRIYAARRNVTGQSVSSEAVATAVWGQAMDRP